MTEMLRARYRTLRLCYAAHRRSPAPAVSYAGCHATAIDDRPTERAQPGPGRPRLVQPRRSGPTARDEILDAAAELFHHPWLPAHRPARSPKPSESGRHRCTTSATKDDILAALLDTTVTGSLDHARRLLGGDRPALDRLLDLARFDVRQLADSRWNLGALYLLPDLRRTVRRLPPIPDRTRRRVRNARRRAIGDPDDPRSAIPFRLVESVIMVRADGPAARPAPTRRPGRHDRRRHRPRAVAVQERCSKPCMNAAATSAAACRKPVTRAMIAPAPTSTTTGRVSTADSNASHPPGRARPAPATPADRPAPPAVPRPPPAHPSKSGTCPD